MRFYEILNEESRVEFLQRVYGERLGAQWREDDPTGAGKHSDAELGRQRLLRLIAYDPTPNKKYLQWIIRQLLDGRIIGEDLYKAHDALAVFDRAKGRMEKRDINQYADYRELEDAVEPFALGEVEVSSGAEKDAYARKMQKESRTVYDSPTIKITVPLTKEASCYFGRNTKWCTAARDDAFNEFVSYNARGPLYIVLDKKSNTRWQMHFDSNQFMNERDRSVSRYDLPKEVWQNPDWSKEPGLPQELKEYLVLASKNPNTLNWLLENLPAESIAHYYACGAHWEVKGDLYKETLLRRFADKAVPDHFVEGDGWSVAAFDRVAYMMISDLKERPYSGGWKLLDWLTRSSTHRMAQQMREMGPNIVVKVGDDIHYFVGRDSYLYWTRNQETDYSYPYLHDIKHRIETNQSPYKDGRSPSPAWTAMLPFLIKKRGY